MKKAREKLTGVKRKPRGNDLPPEDSLLSTGHPWRVTVWALLGLLAAIMIVGLVGVFVNRDIRNAAADALEYDVELEDHGDDLRVAILEVRQQQRTLYFGGQGPTRAGLASLQTSYQLLEEEIYEYAELEVREDDIASPQEIRNLADRYYSDYIAAIEEFEDTGDRAAWDAANDLALARIDEMQLLAGEIDEVGEELSEDSLSRVDREARAGMIAISAVVVGLLLVGAMLSYSTFRVVNELRSLYRKQQKTAEELAAASRAKTDFLADVSHELRTPLTVLRGNAEIGLQLQHDDTQREILSEILTESDKMGRMVEDLLFLSRSDSSSLPLEIVPVEVGTMLSEVAARAAVLARERGSELKTDLQAGGDFELDPPRIEQAVMILVDNAAKYAGQDSPITLSTRSPVGSDLIVEVKDNGPGIPEEELEKIFDRFYRLDKTRSRKLGGTGLGLPIARTIVEAHRGGISAASSPGAGTTMTIRIPQPIPNPELTFKP
ncbi:sensor histidine kinase [Rubrobacter indicoceani]|uniref:sensor histidine kinase n=1 Tax=Rubrobacter indicoceani TaxID=2051957 RepID=UPI000E5B5A16|nr:HAMP domain-containing sensor histidine kinase [Rubrobacter indicoceani]